MYYEEVKKMDYEKADVYDWEIVDGMPRYRWYKHARFAVDMISDCDNNHDIDNQDFSDMKYFYDCMEWVTQKDPEALVYIMGTLTDPVVPVVKDKLIEHLSTLGYYRASAIVKEHLAILPVPRERNFERKRAKAIKEVKDKFVERYIASSELLFKFKTENKDKIYDKRLSSNFGVLLNPWGSTNSYLTDYLPFLDWLLENSPDDLKQLFSVSLCKEMKDQFLQLLTGYEMYKLCAFLNETIETHTMDFYFDIPPYPKEENSFEDLDFI